MSNYDDPVTRTPRTDPNRPHESHSVNVERSSGSGILIAIVAIVVLLGGLFLFFGGSSDTDGTVPATGTAVEEPAATDPAGTAPADDPAATAPVEDPAAAPATDDAAPAEPVPAE